MEDESELTSIVVVSGDVQTKHESWNSDPKPLPHKLTSLDPLEEKLPCDLIASIAIDDQQRRPWIVIPSFLSSPFLAYPLFGSEPPGFVDWSDLLSCCSSSSSQAVR